MEKHVLLKKLRDALESLKGRVAGRNKDDIEEAIAMVSLCILDSSFQHTDLNSHILSRLETCFLLHELIGALTVWNYCNKFVKEIVVQHKGLSM